VTIADVSFAVEGAVGVVTLDRPKALNALTQPMCVAIDRALAAWARDDAVAAVLVRSSTERAFCAGGDVRAVYDDGIAWKRGETPGHLVRDFFRDEYRMNRRIKVFPKPYIAMIDGITMGGGVGLSVHGSHRVATDRTMLAMPETGIGLFPDVGASYVLPRLPGEIGLFLALTGTRIKSPDLIDLGIATHAVAGERIAQVTAELIDAIRPGDPKAAIDRVLGRHAASAGEPDLAARRPLIDRCFAHDDIDRILAALDGEADAFAATIAATIRTMSPTSVKLTLAEMRRGRSQDFDECMRMEYRMTQAVLAGHDFYEGIRAQLVDKDRSPRWAPASLDAVDDDTIASCFLAPAQGDLTFPD